MKLIYLIFSFALLSETHAQVVYAKQPEPGFAGKKIAKEKLLEDISFWHRVMEESHVNLYHAISKEGLEQMENRLVAEIKDSITQPEAILLFGKLSAALNEGHIGLPSGSLSDSLYANSLRFPFLIQKVTDSAWVVSRDISTEQKLGVNAGILSINNIPVSELNKQFREYYGGLETWRKQQIGTYARKLLFLHGIQSPYQVKAITDDGQTIEFSVKGFTRQQGDSINKAVAASSVPGESYSLSMLPGNIAYINYRHMVNNSANPFEDFLKNSFTKIKDSDTKGLVIDLRENGGGNSAYGELLVGYFTNKPYTFSGGMKWKSSIHYKEYLKMTEKGEPSANTRFFNSMKEGDIYSYVNTELSKPKKNSLRYKGRVAVLIGPDTFSSANMLADGIKSYRLATIFGEPTGESGNDFGEMYNFMLPNTYIIARASTKMFTRADRDEKNFEPVIPDVHVISTPEDIKQKKDRVKETAVNWLLKKK